MSETVNIEATINGRDRAFEVAANHTLLDVLRDQLGLTGTKECCVVGECGACTVVVDGIPMNSCLMLAVEIDGRDVTRLPMYRRARLGIGYLPQEPQLNLDKDVRGNVMDGVAAVQSIIDEYNDVMAQWADPDADYDKIGKQQAAVFASPYLGLAFEFSLVLHESGCRIIPAVGLLIHGVSRAGNEQMVTFMKPINFLSIIGGTAPMLGLLGTVSGMIKAFTLIAQEGMGDPGRDDHTDVVLARLAIAVDVKLHLLAPQVEIAITQPDLLARVLLGIDLQRQHLGRRLQGELADLHLDVARRQAWTVISMRRDWEAVFADR